MRRSGFTGSARSLALGAWVLLAGTPRTAAAEPVRINGSGSGLDLMKPLLEAYAASHREERVRLDAPLGTAGSMQAVLEGALDVAVVSRLPSPEEVARGARAHEYGRTPLLIVTHEAVDKKDVTTAELEEIYSRKRTTWPGGQTIRVILRPVKEANTKILSSVSPGMERADAMLRKLPWALVAVTDPESNDMVARTPGAIGAATLTSTIVGQLPLNRLSLDGIEGTTEALARGKYPLSKHVVFVTTARTPPAALAIIAFACSAQGRSVAAKAGLLVTGCGDPVR